MESNATYEVDRAKARRESRQLANELRTYLRALTEEGHPSLDEIQAINETVLEARNILRTAVIALDS